VPKIFYSSASPYSAKVRMAARRAGIEFESVAVDASADPAMLIEANPLGKIPVFVPDDGEAVYDSRAITQYLNRESKNALFPRNPAKRTEAERMEALADGLLDCLLAHVQERRFHSEEKIEQKWLDRQWSKVERVLDGWNANPPKLPARIHAGHLAVRAAIAYLDLRFPGKWEKGRARLRRWAKRFDEKFPELTEYLSRA
jgi:glutathione S-transferase